MCDARRIRDGSRLPDRQGANAEGRQPSQAPCRDQRAPWCLRPRPRPHIPGVPRCMGRIQREHGQPADKKRPLLTAELRRAVAALPDTLAGRRDRTLILIGFAAALRRSELAALEVARCDGGGWIEETSDGLIVHLARTKTDQAGVGVNVGIPYGADPSTCPVRVYRGWLKAAKLRTGPAFRAIDRNGRIRDGALSGQTVARIVKRAVEALALSEGASPKEAARRAAGYAGHSLRAGLATSAAANDAPGHAIQRQLRHKKHDTTLGYIRAGQLFKGNAASFAGL